MKIEIEIDCGESDSSGDRIRRRNHGRVCRHDHGRRGRVGNVERKLKDGHKGKGDEIKGGRKKEIGRIKHTGRGRRRKEGGVNDTKDKRKETRKYGKRGLGRHDKTKQTRKERKGIDADIVQNGKKTGKATKKKVRFVSQKIKTPLPEKKKTGTAEMAGKQTGEEQMEKEKKTKKTKKTEKKKGIGWLCCFRGTEK